MKLRLICVGKLSLPFLRDGAAEYQQRIKRYLPFDLVELKEEKGGGKNPNPQLLKAREGERILDQLRTTGTTLALDEGGREIDSMGLAGLLEGEMSAGTQNLNIIIGGAHGLSPEVRQRADQVISLSRMTFTHQMARMIILEQLYRGLTIIRNEPYHNV